MRDVDINHFFDIFRMKWYTLTRKDYEVKVSDSMIYKNDISNIKTEIGEKLGQKIIIKGSLGRNKPFEEAAVIKETYPNIFVVKYEENNTNVSYRYTDILTRDLEVSVFDGEGYCPLIPPLQKK